MKIEILGTGCRKCETLAANATAAVEDLGLDCVVEKVTDITEITARGVMTTPALAIDGVVKVAGRVLSPDEIKAVIS